ncbi:MAG TPA: Hsp20/alpha crystallin family protein [Acidimicrobiales bacterium]|nr:Hsp20/alpha crystallin family protein [Acidimicrobiales bacterium]
MTLIQRRREVFPETFQIAVPEMFRRMMDFNFDTDLVRVEEYVDDGTLVVRAELPGIDPDKDVELSVTDDVLLIQAHRQERSEHKDKDTYRSEFRYGSFTRHVPLPPGVKADDITATYTDGVLEVHAPMAEEAKPATTKVPVTHS